MNPGNKISVPVAVPADLLSKLTYLLMMFCSVTSVICLKVSLVFFQWLVIASYLVIVQLSEFYAFVVFLKLSQNFCIARELSASLHNAVEFCLIYWNSIVDFLIGRIDLLQQTVISANCLFSTAFSVLCKKSVH